MIARPTWGHGRAGHGGLGGATELYKTATERGVRPIIGCEISVSLGDRRPREPVDKRPLPMTALARNRGGCRHRTGTGRGILAEHAEARMAAAPTGCRQQDRTVPGTRCAVAPQAAGRA